MSKQPLWFKMWLRDQPVLDVLSDASVGKAIKGAMSYFSTGETPVLDPQETILFAILKSHIDEAFSDYRRDVENGKKGGRPKTFMRDDEKPRVKGGNPRYPIPTEEDKEVEEDKEKKEIYKEIVSNLNEKTGKQFRHTSEKTRTAIHARLADGFTVEDFRNVIDTKCADWLGDKKMEEYLRPETLFGTKFEGYLNAGGNHGKSNEQPDGYRIGVHL